MSNTHFHGFVHFRDAFFVETPCMASLRKTHPENIREPHFNLNNTTPSPNKIPPTPKYQKSRGASPIISIATWAQNVRKGRSPEIESQGVGMYPPLLKLEPIFNLERLFFGEKRKFQTPIFMVSCIRGCAYFVETQCIASLRNRRIHELADFRFDKFMYSRICQSSNLRNAATTNWWIHHSTNLCVHGFANHPIYEMQPPQIGWFTIQPINENTDAPIGPLTK